LSRNLIKGLGLDRYQGYGTKARKRTTLSVPGIYVSFIRQEQFNLCLTKFGRGRQHLVTEAKEVEKFSKRPSTIEGQGKGGQGPFWATEPLMMMMVMINLKC
jgi:hypothetical protein